MSTAVKPKLSTSEAAKEAGSFLNLDDTRKLGIALAVAAAEEVARNSAFAERVRALYSQQMQTRTASRRRTAENDLSALTTTLVPIKRIEGVEINAAAQLDPYLLNEVYGPEQLSTALGLFSVKKLQEATEVVMRNHPGTKPVSRARKAALIDYLVQYVIFAD